MGITEFNLDISQADIEVIGLSEEEFFRKKIEALHPDFNGQDAVRTFYQPEITRDLGIL